jgi:hypothetical protein
MAIQQSPFEPMFAKHASTFGIPHAYLRTLAYKESGFRPAVVHPRSRATGLFQITSIALNAFNQRNRSGLQLAHLVDPEINTRVAAEHLARVIDVYRSYRSLQPDWSSQRWVELLTLGWNAGHNAVAQIAGRLEAQRIPPERITVDTVSQVAATLGGSAVYVGDPARVAWAKSVAAMFLGKGVPGAVYASTLPIPGGSGGALALLGLVAVGAAIAAVAAATGGKEEEEA